MYKIIRSMLAFLVIAFTEIPCVLAVAEEFVELKYKPEENLSYLVERKLTLLKKHMDDEISNLDEEAVVTFSKASKAKNGDTLIPSSLTLLNVSGTMKKNQINRLQVLPPGRKKYPTGRLTKFAEGNRENGRPWDVHLIFRTFEAFPIFPQRPVKNNDVWDVQMDMRFCGRPNFNSKVTISHRLANFKIIDGKKLALIKYKFSGVLETANHPEIIKKDRILEKIKPKYTLNGVGKILFDPIAGIVVNKEQEVKWSNRWTGSLDPSLLENFPEWEINVDQVFTCSIKAKLISKDKAQNLVAQAKNRKSNLSDNNEKENLTPKWTYYLKRTTIKGDKIKKTNKKLIDYALITYGLKQPEVVYVDDKKMQLKSSRKVKGRAIQPLQSEKLSLLSNLPNFGGTNSKTGWPVALVVDFFDILPMKPEGEMAEEHEWEVKIPISFSGQSKMEFIATVKHMTKGFHQIQGKKSLKIDYSISGAFNSSEHPELFPNKELSENKLIYSIFGEGTVHFDIENDIVLTKEQSLSWTSKYEILKDFGNSDIRWVPEFDNEEKIILSVSLQNKNELEEQP